MMKPKRNSKIRVQEAVKDFMKKADVVTGDELKWVEKGDKGTEKSDQREC